MCGCEGVGGGGGAQQADQMRRAQQAQQAQPNPAQQPPKVAPQNPFDQDVNEIKKPPQEAKPGNNDGARPNRPETPEAQSKARQMMNEAFNKLKTMVNGVLMGGT